MKISLNKTSLLFPGAFAIVGLSVALDFAFLRKDTTGPQAQDNELNLSATSTPLSTVATADWRSYRNEKYKFTVKYPNDWIVQDITVQPGVRTSYLLLLVFKPPSEPGDVFDLWVSDEWKKDDFPCSNGRKLARHTN